MGRDGRGARTQTLRSYEQVEKCLQERGGDSGGKSCDVAPKYETLKEQKLRIKIK